MKHECGFTLTLSANPNDPPGTLVWTTPSGREYPSYPAQLGKPVPSRKPSDECQACSEAGRVNAAEEQVWEMFNQPSRSSTAASGSGSDMSGSDISTESPVEEATSDESAEPWLSRLRMRRQPVLSPLPKDGYPPPF
jgi:hypothetical protein